MLPQVPSLGEPIVGSVLEVRDRERVGLKRSFKRIRMLLSLPRLLPHLAFLLAGPRRDVIKIDLISWAVGMGSKKPQSSWEFIVWFIECMTFLPEFRNLFYIRVGQISWPFMWLCPRMKDLDLDVGSIGPGLYIQHGQSTFVSAESIGANCTIGRHVVIGYSNRTDRPTIGNNVHIYAGAKIIGKINLGDNSVVGLNSVVITNVEPNVTVFGVPAKAISRSAG